MLGIDLLRDLRRTHHTPVLILSSLVELDAKLSSLTAGADDYMTKPFNMKELLARAHAVIRRAVRSDGPAMVAGRLRLSLSKMILEIDDEPVRVTPTEFSILEHLLRSKDRIVSKDSLAAYVYGNSKQRDPRIIEVFVSKLRQKLAASAPASPSSKLFGAKDISSEQIAAKWCRSPHDIGILVKLRLSLLDMRDQGE